MEKLFKKALSFTNECFDHCVTFAFSEEKDISCVHVHQRNCIYCNTLDLFLKEISSELNFESV